MRKARIIEEGAAYYHTMSRVVDRRFVFDEAERERVRKLMRAVAGLGVDVLTYTVLSNHYTRRMSKLPEFMKMFKQEVSLSYNRRHGSSRPKACPQFPQFPPEVLR